MVMPAGKGFGDVFARTVDNSCVACHFRILGHESPSQYSRLDKHVSLDKFEGLPVYESTVL